MPLYSLFQSPSPAFRGKPFWSWNGWLEKERLLWQIDRFHEMGMGGFFMHSRTGLETEYLGKEWFELINACADYASELGMEAWIYDEDRWPSGSAGGLATRDPRLRLQSLRLTLLPPLSLDWGKVPNSAHVFEARVVGLEFSESRRLTRGEQPKEGFHALVFTTETTLPHSFYNGNTYLDTLQAAATTEFLRVTHERYRENCGRRLGTSIRGVFTDEPHRGMVMCKFVETRQEEAPEWTTPYTPALFAEFKKRFGYSLEENLPELFLFPAGTRISQVKWHYMELLQQLFLENWAAPVLRWCRRNGLLLTGHVLHEDSLAAQAVPCGSVMRYYEYLDLPGVDVLGLHNRNYCIVKQLSSAARQLGKPWLLSELYGCTGWQLDFAGHKEIGLWQALYGINVRCHHLSWYSMAGEAKRDYPASIFFQSGWFRHYKKVEDFFSRFHVALHSGKPACQLLVLHPVESFWAQIHVGWAKWMESDCPALLGSEARFQQLFEWLSCSSFDFDYADEAILASRGRLEKDRDGNPQLRVGRAVYQAVLVSGLDTLRSSSLELLKAFAGMGGSVLFSGPPPTHLDALPSPAPADLASCTLSVPFEKQPLIEALASHLRIPFKIQSLRTDGESDLRFQLRKDGTTSVLALINVSSERAHPHVSISFSGTGFVEEWDCNTGERFHQPAGEESGQLHWKTEIPPLGERIFVIQPESSALPVRTPIPKTTAHPLNGPFRFNLDEPNLCVLDFAEYRLGDSDWAPAAEILQIDEAIRSFLGFPQRSGVMVQPWATRHPLLSTENPGQTQSTRLQLRFAFDIDSRINTPIELLIEDPEGVSVRINQIPLILPSDPASRIDPCLKAIPIPENLLRLGTNQVELDLLFSPKTQLEAVCLAGDFAVFLDGRNAHLDPMPDTLQPGDLTLQGLPFYSGSISYRIPVPDNSGTVWLETGTFGGALASVEPGDSAILWPPYITKILLDTSSEIRCRVWLTRRNTFGPLHLRPKNQTHIGPASFRSKGNQFSETYQLFPSGLLTPPILHIPE
ncbi:MAG: hypothetical protein RLZZ253_1048 [Verrucomicrobiota bacterium]